MPRSCAPSACEILAEIGPMQVPRLVDCNTSQAPSRVSADHIRLKTVAMALSARSVVASPVSRRSAVKCSAAFTKVSSTSALKSAGGKQVVEVGGQKVRGQVASQDWGS